MNRKTVYAALGISVLMVFAGCKDSKSPPVESSVSSSVVSSSSSGQRFGVTVVDDTKEAVKILDYVELGDYKGLKLEKEKNEITDEDVEAAILDSLANTQIIDGAAEAGDRVFISYTGTVDDVKVQEASVDGLEIVIGEGGMPGEAEEALIGMKVGEEKEVKVILPDSYPAQPELAGKEVTYNIQLLAVTRSYTELTEKWLQANTEYETEEEYREAVRANLKQNSDMDEENTYASLLWEEVLEASKVKAYLKSGVDAAEEQYNLNLDNLLAMAGINLEAYRQQQGLTEEAFEKQKGDEILRTVKQDMVMQAIAEKEGFSDDDAEYEQQVKAMAEEYQMTEESLTSMYGKEDLKKPVRNRRVMKLIVDTAEEQSAQQ